MKVDTIRKFLNRYRKLFRKGWVASMNGELIVLAPPNSRRRAYCPITAVCKAETGKFFLSLDWQEAGNFIGMDDTTRCYVIQASVMECKKDGSLIGDTFEKLRCDLIEASHSGKILDRVGLLLPE